MKIERQSERHANELAVKKEELVKSVSFVIIWFGKR